MEAGTLKELDVKPGDVVEFLSGDVVGFEVGQNYECVAGKDGFGKDAIGPINEHGGCIPSLKSDLLFHLISRASDTPKTWGEMNPEEKGALLLAAHEGKVIEVWDDVDLEWLTCRYPNWTHGCAYRLPPEPKRETVTFLGCAERGFDWSGWGDETTHRITFDLIDGEPDVDSIRMEEI